MNMHLWYIRNLKSSWIYVYCLDFSYVFPCYIVFKMLTGTKRHVSVFYVPPSHPPIKKKKKKEENFHGEHIGHSYHIPDSNFISPYFICVSLHMFQ